MTTPHQENWDVYFCHVQDKPAVVTLDLGWQEPLPTHPHLFTYSIGVRKPNANGFPEKEENETVLYPIEDTVRPALEAAEPDIIYVGKMVHDARVRFYFYCSTRNEPQAGGIIGKLFGRAQTSSLRLALDEAMKAFPTRDYSSGERAEPRWDTCFSLLCPGEWESQQIMSQRALRQARARGDQTGRVRAINHFIVCTRAENRARIAADAQALGFGIRLAEQKDDRQGVELTQDGIPDNIDDIVWPLFELARQHGATYDGWGCAIVTGRA